MTPTPTIPAPAARRLPTDASVFGPDEQPAPTIRVPVLEPRKTDFATIPPAPFAPVTPAPSSERRISRSVLANVDRHGEYHEFPHVGERFLGFRLVDELGNGAFAKVFLAQQESLAGRPVALKVTLRPTREAERLARLQHTNVVPVYSVHDAGPVQVICMPFLGRKTIADLVRAFRSEHSSRGFSGHRTAGTRPARTTAVTGHSNLARNAESGTRPVPLLAAGELPPLIGDPLAVVRVLAQLAAGLAHAHQRGILHLDLKPANVLLPDAGEPMLLDFNLSFDATAPQRELVGGTVPYMAIEQLLDLKSRGLGVIDARTDLYSLGVMAFEMLTGTVPFPATSNGLKDVEQLIAAREAGPPSIRALNPAVSPAVEAIVHKLLAPRPADRYQTAEELRTDAERHLKDLPLLHAGEPSIRERAGKWRRRNPGVPLRLMCAVFVGLAIGLGAVAHIRAESGARLAAADKMRQARSGLDALRLDLVLSGDPQARARGVAKAEEFLAAYGLPEDADWTAREDVRRLPESERTGLGADLGEVLLLLGQAKWEAASGKSDAARREAAAQLLALNRAAGHCFPPGSAPQLLDRQGAELAAAAGDPDVPQPRPAVEKGRPARDLFLDAADGISRGRYTAAIPLLKRVIGDQPGHAAAQFCLAFCLQQTGEYKRALERYDAAEVLLPADPRPAFQRGVVYGTQLKPADAEAEFTRVLELEPNNADAYRGRGLARFHQGEAHLRDAAADFTAALAKGGCELQLRLLRARVYSELGDKDAAKADRDAAAGLEPRTERDYLVRGAVRMKADPKGAMADFKAALELNPRSLIAIQNQAHLFADKLNDAEAALAAATRACELYPQFAPARVGRAVVLARCGKPEEARREAEKARALSDDPLITYQVGCVYALTSKANPDDTKKAFDAIRKAIGDGYRDLKMFREDSDLNPLRGLQDFRTLQLLLTELCRPA